MRCASATRVEQIGNRVAQTMPAALKAGHRSPLWPGRSQACARRIGESLVMTALGLAVAIPAVLGYNALVRGNKGVLQKLSRFAHDLHAYFVTGARVKSGQANVVAMKKA